MNSSRLLETGEWAVINVNILSPSSSLMRRPVAVEVGAPPTRTTTSSTLGPIDHKTEKRENQLNYVCDNGQWQWGEAGKGRRRCFCQRNRPRSSLQGLFHLIIAAICATVLLNSNLLRNFALFLLHSGHFINFLIVAINFCAIRWNLARYFPVSSHLSAIIARKTTRHHSSNRWTDAKKQKRRGSHFEINLNDDNCLDSSKQLFEAARNLCLIIKLDWRHVGSRRLYLPPSFCGNFTLWGRRRSRRKTVANYSNKARFNASSLFANRDNAKLRANNLWKESGGIILRTRINNCCTDNRDCPPNPSLLPCQRQLLTNFIVVFAKRILPEAETRKAEAKRGEMNGILTLLHKADFFNRILWAVSPPASPKMPSLYQHPHQHSDICQTFQLQFDFTRQTREKRLHCDKRPMNRRFWRLVLFSPHNPQHCHQSVIWAVIIATLVLLLSSLFIVVLDALIIITAIASTTRRCCSVSSPKSALFIAVLSSAQLSLSFSTILDNSTTIPYQKDEKESLSVNSALDEGFRNSATKRIKVKQCKIVTRSVLFLFIVIVLVINFPAVMSSSQSSSAGSSSSSTLNNVKYSTNVVKTKYGPLRGIWSRSNPQVEAFLGVPYATPPVGSLRYMPPMTPSAWKSTRLADRFAPVCPQRVPVPANGDLDLLDEPRERLAQLRRFYPLLANQSEDCLYLNIYVPKSESEGGSGGGSGTGGKSTIVYIHGESYEWNAGNLYDGSTLAAHGNVIVVTINFRLGILGFLKTGTKESAQGNFGLMDLVAGLHWLRENLPAFEGDGSKITVMGHGTGASLANILVVSPVASDLITRVILLSGSALSPWAIQREPLIIKKRVAEHTGCHGDLLEDDLAPCLRTKSLKELLSVTLDTPRFLPGFAPFIDGTVIVNPNNIGPIPLKLPMGSAIVSTSGIEFANYPNKEILFGLTTIESYLDLNAQDLEFGFNETRRDRILRTFVRNVFHFHLNEIYSALKNEYTDWERAARNQIGSRDATLELLSDGHTAAPLVRMAYMHSLRGGRSYFLHFRHQSSERDFPQRIGSVRGEDVPFCLGLPLTPLFPYNYTKQDYKVSRILMHYIANFAKLGNPNGPSTSDISKDIAQGDRSIYISSNSKKYLLNSDPSFDADKISRINSDIVRSNGPSRRVKSKRRRKRQNRVQREQHWSLGGDKDRFLRQHEQQRQNSHKDDLRQMPNDQEQEQQPPPSSSHPPGPGGDQRLGSEEEEEEGNENGTEEEQEQEERGEKLSTAERQTAANDDDDDYLTETHSSRDNDDDLQKITLPFWDTYDTINQLYLELGQKAETKNHYRGHKLSIWLNLIPQLHSVGDSDLPMKHHHFAEDRAQFYDGIIRTQSNTPPPRHEILIVPPVTVQPPVFRQQQHHQQGGGSSPIPQTTDCPVNLTALVGAPTQVNLPEVIGVSGGSGGSAKKTTNILYYSHQNGTDSMQNDKNSFENSNNFNLLRRLANSQFQSYATALTVTIVVGCFLLLLNVIIFFGIYYQREKRVNDARKKEELSEVERMDYQHHHHYQYPSSRSPSQNSEKSYVKSGCSSGNTSGPSGRKASFQSLKNFNTFNEYRCYDEKNFHHGHHHHHSHGSLNKKYLTDMCNSVIELPMDVYKENSRNPDENVKFRMSREFSASSSHIENHACPRRHSMVTEGTQSDPISLKELEIETNSQLNPTKARKMNKGTLSSKEIRTISTTGQEGNEDNCDEEEEEEEEEEEDEDEDQEEEDLNDISPDIPEPPPPPRTSVACGGGILRSHSASANSNAPANPGSSSTATPSTSKKRVQIQEISV